MRVGRLIVGALIIAGAGAIVVGEQLSGASDDGVVNASLTVVRAPIAGIVTLKPHWLGASVSAAEVLGSIADPHVDDIHLNDLVHQRAGHAADVERLTRQIEDLTRSIDQLSAHSADYRVRRVQQLEADLLASQAQVRGMEARLVLKRSSLQRSSELQRRGVQADATLDAAVSEMHVAEQDLAESIQRAAMIDTTLEAARTGILLADGANDYPYSEQKIIEYSVLRDQLLAELELEGAHIAALDVRLGVEQVRVNRLRTATLIANVGGRIWEILAADGEAVQRGQDVIRLVECSSVIVTLSVAQSVYNRLQLGDEAQFRMDGNTRIYDGTISRLAGSGAATIYRNLAVAPGEKHLERYDVTLAVPSLAKDDTLDCPIGRTGRVFFKTRPLDFLRRIWS